MNCRPLYVGKSPIGDRFDDDSVFIFFGNKTFTENEHARIFPERILKFLKQVHGDKIIKTDAKTPTRETSADAFFTQEVDVALGVYTADCLPVLMHDVAGKQIAACHAGWRGVANSIIMKTLLEMNPKNKTQVRVWIGPHIKKDSFEVHNDVAEILVSAYPGKENVLYEHKSDTEKKQVDLTEIAISQLLSQGIEPANIWIHPADTFKDINYYSYRRSGPTGRLISTITLLK